MKVKISSIGTYKSAKPEILVAVSHALASVGYKWVGKNPHTFPPRSSIEIDAELGTMRVKKTSPQHNSLDDLTFEELLEEVKEVYADLNGEQRLVFDSNGGASVGCVELTAKDITTIYKASQTIAARKAVSQ